MSLQPNTCQGPDLTCYNWVMERLGRWNHVLDTSQTPHRSRRCLGACETTSFSDLTIASSPFPARRAFPRSRLACVVARKVE